MKPPESAPCVRLRNHVVLLCFVEDLILNSEKGSELRKLEMQLKVKWPANEMGKAAELLEMEVHKGFGCVPLVQGKQIEASVDLMELAKSHNTRVQGNVSVEWRTANGRKAYYIFECRRIVRFFLHCITHSF